MKILKESKHAQIFLARLSLDREKQKIKNYNFLAQLLMIVTIKELVCDIFSVKQRNSLLRIFITLFILIFLLFSMSSANKVLRLLLLDSLGLLLVSVISRAGKL